MGVGGRDGGGPACEGADGVGEGEEVGSRGEGEGGDAGGGVITAVGGVFVAVGQGQVKRGGEGRGADKRDASENERSERETPRFWARGRGYSRNNQTYEAITFLLSTSQMRILKSRPDDARYFPFGENASSVMACRRRLRDKRNVQSQLAVLCKRSALGRTQGEEE